MPGMLNTDYQDNNKTMFSIEQIELIRRLRNSGITKEQVVEAFDSLDRIDGELGTLYNTPVNRNQRQQENKDNRHHGKTQQTNYYQNPSNPLSHDTHYNDTNSRISQVPISHNMTKTLPKIPNEVTSYTVSNTHPNTQQALHIHHSTTNSSQQEPTNYHNVTDTSQLEPMDHRQMKTLPTLQLPVMYNQGTLTKLSSTTNVSMVEVNSETKSYKNNIGQHGITTKLSPLLISKMSPGSSMTRQTNLSAEVPVDNYQTDQIKQQPSFNCPHYEDTSPSKKPRIAETIDLVETDSNEQIVDFIESALQDKMDSIHNSQVPVTIQRVLLPDGQELVANYQRRERFTFREKHLQVLESCFKENPYPSYDRREAIANLCNLSCSNNGEKPLHNRQKVTAHMVLNWFANSRKEVKRLAKKGGVVASASILPSRLNKNKPLLSDENTAHDTTEENIISDQSNDSIQTSDDKGKQEDFIIIKCENDEPSELL